MQKRTYAKLRKTKAGQVTADEVLEIVDVTSHGGSPHDTT